MSLYKWVRDDVAKYSFIKKVDFKNATFYMFYEYEGKLKHKKVPYRTTPKQLIRAINSIKKEIGYEEMKQQEHKENKRIQENLDRGFLFTN